MNINRRWKLHLKPLFWGLSIVFSLKYVVLWFHSLRNNEYVWVTIKSYIFLPNNFLIQDIQTLIWNKYPINMHQVSLAMDSYFPLSRKTSVRLYIVCLSMNLFGFQSKFLFIFSKSQIKSINKYHSLAILNGCHWHRLCISKIYFFG